MNMNIDVFACAMLFFISIQVSILMIAEALQCSFLLWYRQISFDRLFPLFPLLHFRISFPVFSCDSLGLDVEREDTRRLAIFIGGLDHV